MKQWMFLGLMSAAIFVFVFSGPAWPENYKGFERGHALITPGELKSLIDANDEKLVLVGVVRAGVTGPFTRGHIPGAYSAWRADYMTEKGEPYPFAGMTVDRMRFQDFARSLGVDDDSKVVLYDEALDATHLWWIFYLYGRTDIRILDGGYEAWKAAGYDTEFGGGRKRSSKRGNFAATPARPGWAYAMDDVRGSKSDTDVQLWDTREPDEWSGKRLLRGASRPGRIPWAEFLNWKQFKKEVKGKMPTEFRSAAEIQAIIDEYGLDESKDQAFYCQSGVRTTTEIFALYLMGWDPEKLHNYDGSWIEWSYHKENPAETD